MKFGEKYELLESLTTGGVETFVANDKVRGERVLVHILHCDPQRPNQPTVQWVLEAFRRVAPEPAGLVLEAGRYSGTLYAYLVSKLPEDAALQGWVRQYKAQARDTQEFPRPIAKPTRESEAPTSEVSPKAPERAPGPVTQLFRDFAPPAKPGARDSPAGAPVKETEPASQPLPQYPPQSLPKADPFADSGRFRPSAPWDAETPRAPLPPRTELSGSIPVDSFRTDFAPKTFPSETINPAVKDGPKAGDFTSFFQGPFRGDRPSPTPAVSSQPMEPPRKTVGDFTAMFGPLKPQPEEPPPAAGIAGNEPAGTGFTGWFTPDMPSRTSSTTAPPPVGLPRAVVDPTPVIAAPLKEPSAAPPAMSYVAPTPPIFSTPTPPPPPMVKLPVAAPSALPSDGATRAFARPVIEPPAGPPPPPSGPSAYTQVISMKAMNPAGDAAGAGKQAPGKAAPPAFAAPSMPSIPAVAPPPMPAIAVPAPPKPPKAPKAPQGAIPQPPVSYWPLILTLAVLFVVAVLLVLYFVLKH
jgi:hypothetical protein